MAGWISSKLKVAENLLQQIDQQAAESLRKGERKQSEASDCATSPTPSSSVSLRDQLKKNAALEKSDGKLGKLNIESSANNNSGSNFNQDQSSSKQKWDSHPKSSNTIRDSDWTELLSTPKQPIVGTKPNRARGAASRARGARKVGGTGVNVGVNLKGDGKPVGRGREAGDGNAGKADAGVGGGRINREGSGKSSSNSGVFGLGSGEKVIEGWEPAQDSGNRGNPEGSKETEHERVILADVNPVVEDDTPYVGHNPDLLSGMGEGNSAQVSIKGKEANLDDEKIGRATIIRDIRTGDGAGCVSGGLKSGSHSTSVEESNSSDSDSESSSTSDSEVEREREQRIQRRRQILAAKAAAKALEAIKEQENVVARLEGEKQSLAKILEERAKQAEQEASELQSTMMEMMEAAELEKQKHNHTRMELLTRLAKLETTNADLAKSLAAAQWNLGIEVNHVADLRQQVEVKEVVLEELKKMNFSTHEKRRSRTSLTPSKGFEMEKKMLEAEYSFVADTAARLEEKTMKLEVNIDSTVSELENPTEVEVELKRRLRQMTDHLIQKQAQVEALSSDKAMLLFRIEAVSRLLDENKSLTNEGDISGSSRDDLEAGTWETSGSKLHPVFKSKIQSGKEHLGSLLRQLDALFSAGAVFLARNPAAKLWSVVYLVCLHLWVLYILFSHSQSTETSVSRSVLSLENINNSIGV